MESKTVSKSAEILTRSHRLAYLLLEDVERPWYLIEFANLLGEVAGVVVDLCEERPSLDSMELKITSLEHRYSELLYKLSGKSERKAEE